MMMGFDRRMLGSRIVRMFTSSSSDAATEELFDDEIRNF